MKKAALFLHLLMLAIAWCFVGCSDDKTDPVPDPVPVPEETSFTLSVANITTTGCIFSVTPADAHMSYIAMLIEKSVFDAYASDEACIEADLADFSEEAELEGITLSQLLINTYLRYGRLEVEIENDLTPGTEYYLYAYGMSEAGEPTSRLEKLAFRSVDVERVDVVFDIRIRNLGYTDCEVAVSATPADAKYFINVIDEETYQEFGGDASAFAAYTNFVVKYNGDKYGAAPEALLKAWGKTGEASFESSGLKSGKKYYAYAIGVNERFQPNSDPASVEFVTKTAEASDNTFTAEFSDVSYTSVTGTIRPANDDLYIWGIQTKEDIDNFYATDAEVMEALCGMYSAMGVLDSYLAHGNTEFTVGSLTPETDYYLLVFGWDQAVTTGLTKIPVRTIQASGDPAQLELEFHLSNVTHKSVEIAITPSNGAPYYYDVIEAEQYEALQAELGSVDATVLQLAAESIEYAAEWNGVDPVEFLEYFHSLGPISETWVNGEPETSYIVFGCAVDLETGSIASGRGFVSEIFTTEPRVVSNAGLTFGMEKYFRSDEIAASDPDKYGSLPANHAVMNYKLTPNADAVHWYSCFYPTSDYVTYFDDDTLIEFLVYYGYEQGLDPVQYDLRRGTYVFPWYSEYSFVAVAEDASGVFGPVCREVVTLSPDGASPAGEFVPNFQSLMRAAAKSAAQQQAKDAHRASRFAGKKLL